MSCAALQQVQAAMENLNWQSALGQIHSPNCPKANMRLCHTPYTSTRHQRASNLGLTGRVVEQLPACKKDVKLLLTAYQVSDVFMLFLLSIAGL